MASIRRSARIETVTAQCGHKVLAYIPPGNIGPVGRRNIDAAAGGRCPECRQAAANIEPLSVYPNPPNPSVPATAPPHP